MQRTDIDAPMNTTAAMIQNRAKVI